MREVGLWNSEQGQNWLDGGAPFYSVYMSKDREFFSVAPIEQKFYRNFIQVLKEKGLSENDYQYLLAHQFTQDEWPDMKVVIAGFFSRHKSAVLEKAFNGRDCCVQRVLN